VPARGGACRTLVAKVLSGSEGEYVRTVAKFQLASTSNAIDEIARVVERWAEKKFVTNEDGSVTIKRSRATALFERRNEIFGNDRQIVYTIFEEVPGGNLETQIRAISNKDGTVFQCILRLGSEEGLLPPRVDIRSPKFIREIIDLKFEWRVSKGAERVFPKYFNVKYEDTDILQQLISTPHRRLPIVLVSELQGKTIAGDLHERVSADICGLAHTCRISDEISWELTRRLGREWSCYNGAVRLFWPFRFNRDDPYAHPLWTYDSLMRRAENERAACGEIRRNLIERVIEASTFVADDPSFSRFDIEKAHQVNNEARANAVDSGDFKALAELYAVENDTLRIALDAQTQRVKTLEENVEALTIALRSGRAALSAIAEQTPPTSVEDAVRRARASLDQIVLFSDNIEQDIKLLNRTAGPPEKLLRYLMTLGELSKQLKDGKSLGQSLPIWLRERNVDCSGESETIRNNKEARRRRTFVINGEESYCEYHLKPSDGTSPDLCIRIYFIISNQAPHVRIGYIGRHFD
jgi:hypothetical protein